MGEKFPTPVRCPKCRSRTIWLNEQGYWSSCYEVIDGVLDREGFLEPGGVERVYGCCKRCQHRWTLRNVIQITDCYGQPS